MLLRLSRLSLWLAAAASGMAYFGPDAWSGLYADTALALAGAAFVLWRGALAMRRRLDHPADAVPEGRLLDAAALAEGSALVMAAAQGAPSFDAALLRVGDLLRGELGARTVRVFAVSQREDTTDLAELIAAHPGFRAPRRPLSPADSIGARALRELRACIDLPRGVALPVLRDGAPVALLELTGIEVGVDEAALAGILDQAMAALAARVERDAAAPLQSSRPDAALRAPRGAGRSRVDARAYA